jgi:hypothetical protein
MLGYLILCCKLVALDSRRHEGHGQIIGLSVGVVHNCTRGTYIFAKGPLSPIGEIVPREHDRRKALATSTGRSFVMLA